MLVLNVMSRGIRRYHCAAMPAVKGISILTNGEDFQKGIAYGDFINGFVFPKYKTISILIKKR